MLYWLDTFIWRTIISEAVEDYTYDFIQSYGNEPLLNAAEEVKLMTQIREGEVASQTLEDAQAIESLSGEDLNKLRWQAKRGKRAQERFIKANIRLSMHVARKYTGRGLPFGDLVQEGVFGIAHAIKKFEPSRGNRFSTYATPWIRQYISRAVINTGSTIRVPEHRVNEIYKVNRVRQGLLDELGREPTEQEVSEASGKPLSTVEALARYSQQPISLHAPVGDDIDELGDILVDDSVVLPDESYEEAYLSEQIRRVFDGLTEREAQLMSLKYGLGETGAPQSLAAAAETMDISRERARQLERTALAKLRHPKNQHLHQFIASD